MGIFGDIMSKIFGQSAKAETRSRHRAAFSVNSAASVASSVRHCDKNRTGSRGSEG